MAKLPDGRLLCRNGHAVDKVRRLKPWQGFLHGKECSVCMGNLDREEVRWTCSGRCSWSVCYRCYDQHWSRVIQRASQTSDGRSREALLAAVPEARRRTKEYLMAVDQGRQGRQALLTPTPDWRVPMSPNVSPQSEPAQSPAASSPSLCGGTPTSQTAPAWKSLCLPRDELAQVALWLVLGTLGTGVAFGAASELLRREDLAFPHPFLVVGFSQLLVLLLCRLVGYLIGSPEAAPVVVQPPLPQGPLPPGAAPQDPVAAAREAEWKAAGVLGLMYGVDVCIGTSILYHLSLASRDAAYVFTPAAMLGAGILAGTDYPERRCIQSVAGMTLGGLLMVANGFVDWGVVQLILLALLGDAVKMFRWVFTRNVLPEEGGAAVLLFVARMTTSTAALGFELTFITDFSSYAGLFYLPNIERVALLTLATAAGLTAKLVSELHLAQLTSLTVLGFFTPALNVGFTFSSLVLGGSGPSVLQCLGALLFLVGAGFYCWLRLTQEQPQQDQDGLPVAIVGPQVDGAGYVRLPAEGLVRQQMPQGQQWLRPPQPPAAGFTPLMGGSSPSVRSVRSNGAPGLSHSPGVGGRVQKTNSTSPRPSPRLGGGSRAPLPVPTSSIRSAPAAPQRRTML